VRFKIKLRYRGHSEEFWNGHNEPEVKSLEAAKMWAQEMLGQYNVTLLSAGEPPRELLDVQPWNDESL